jgi:glutathione S-transferase
MRAVLRYRRIPFQWVLRNSEWDDLPDVPVQIIPVLAFPDEQGNYGEAMVDSSPQITRLEADHAGRSLIPTDPALAFIDFLIEDFADEWVTKIMYHYRWTYEADIEKAGRLLPLDQDLQLDDDRAAQFHDFIIERQVGRRALVGSTNTNQPIIEGSYLRLLDILQEHLGAAPFLLGERPGRGDFGLYGQLKPLLWWDPTPVAIAVNRSPRAVNWIERVDDLSWWPTEADAGWSVVDQLGPGVHRLLAEIGRTYAPFMVANAAALAAGADEVVCEIDGQEYRQGPFNYQGKCLGWVRDAYAALDDTSRATVDSLLAGTGCEPLLA